MRRRRGIKKPRINIFKLLSILLIITFVGLIPMLIKKLITISKIECKSQYQECSEEIKSTYNIYESYSLKTAKEGVSRALDDSYLVESYLIQYQIPSTLKIDLVIKKPKYAIKDKNTGVFYLLDKDGVALEQKGETDLPYVISENPGITLGEKCKDNLIFVSEILYNLNWLYTVNSGEVRNEGFFVKLSEGPMVIFPFSGDVKALVGSLRLIYSRLNESNSSIRMENVREIDLRFDKPVIR